MKRISIPLLFIFLMTGGALTLAGCQKPEVKKPVACTEEAKLCPDGSAVGRTGPDCAFAACPQAKIPDVEPITPKPPFVTPKPPIMNPKPTGNAADNTVPFGKPVTLRVADMLAFPDGLVLTLKEIGDSRCPAGVQCIWQGELAPTLIATANGTSDEIRLGTVRQTKTSLKGHTFSLEGATEETATILVSMEDGIR